MIYFDHAATSFPKPLCVLDAVNDCIRNCGGNPGRGGHRLSLCASETVYNARQELADLLFVKAEQIVFAQNATMALNLAIRTRARKGSRILISDQEHNATLRVIYALKDSGLITYDIFPSLGCEEDLIERFVYPDTDILVCNLTSNVTGNTLPLSALLSVARRHGIYLIIDASQWLGHHPIPREIGEADAICAPGHKGLYGIQGSGFVYLKNAEALPPFIYGGSGVESDKREMPHRAPERFEAGTLNACGIVGLCEGIKFIKREGAIEKERELADFLVSQMSCVKGAKLIGNPSVGVVGLSLYNHDCVDVATRLDREYNIATRAGLHCAPMAHRTLGTISGGLLRFSTGFFNTKEDISSAAFALE
ncbi:MAG: aminotransferase class V-fold PLP-dependent enzyme, partial [Clostridia bacterium]|nr:aminotransferase class V-fold PLP-dependent enzyme [Clostridia bacterium]